MDQKYENFLSPITIRGKTWKNRSVAAPMGGAEGENGHLSEHGKYFTDYYTGGEVAEYILGETDISRIGSRAQDGRYFDVREPLNKQILRECADRVHAHGVLATIELCHCGATKIGSPGNPVVGPSAMVRASDGVQIQEMTEQDISDTVRDFAEAAAIVKECGFDGAVIHAGHEWLPHQFLSKKCNFRTDRFGGSIENRARFLVLVLDAVREACGEDFVIEIRISGEENEPDPGYSLEENCRFCEIFAEHCDIIHVSAGRYYNPVNSGMMSCIYQPHGLNVAAAAEIKKHVSIPVAVVGGINDPEMCEQIIAEGKADFIVMGRQRLADADFAKKCMEGRSDEIRPCLRCTRCFPGPAEEAIAEFAEQLKNTPESGMDPLDMLIEQISSCSVNAEFKHGKVSAYAPAERSKRVLVVGGGCAGMQAALTAAERGHQVTLIEQADRLGGILHFADEDENKQDLAKLAFAMEAQVRHANIDIRLNTPFSKSILDELQPESVIAAIGSSPAVPPIPGLTGSNVVQAMQVYRKDTVIPEQAIVLGGGTVGCETAIHLLQAGCQVALVEMAGRLCADAYRLHGIKLRELLQELNCEVYLNTTCRSVEPDGVTAENESGTLKLTAPVVINALGMKANSCDAIREVCAGLEYHEIGDCVKARNIAVAVDEGFVTALNL